MDSFFGIGAPELILILIIAGIVMGPERIGRTARWLGQTVGQLQNISRAFVRQLNAELDSADSSGEAKKAWEEVQELRRQLNDLRGEVMSATGGAVKDTRKAVADAKAELNRTIAPPNLTQPRTENGTIEEIPPPPAPEDLPRRVEVPDDPE